MPLVPLPSLVSGGKPLAPAAAKPPSAAPGAPAMVKVAAPWYTQGTVLIESVVNERWLLEAGPDHRVGKIRGQEGGWTGKNSKPVVSADDNYYDRARWKLLPGDHTPAPEKSLVPVPISQAPDPPNAVGPTGSTSGFVGGRDIWNAFILEGQPEPASPDLFIFR